MRTVLDILPDSVNNNPDLGARADAYQLRIAQAYAAVFSGNGSVDDAGLVLIDLAQFTRYYDTVKLNASAAEAHGLNHRRAVFQRIAEGVIVSGNTLDGLHAATLRAPLIEDPNEEN